jgi:A/G-specific adenine glycosylase
MLQQTQVERVRSAYQAFIKRFPTVHALAEAPLRDVLVLWQGLGYNRRAKALHDASRAIVASHNGKVPRDEVTLCTLPGIGPYTAGAVCAFAYNTPTVMIETNIRTVLLHELLPYRREVPDSELRDIIVAILDTQHPREWYWALMDYGTYLKKQGVRVNVLSRQYVKQAPFKGSLREVRGAVLKTLSRDGTHTMRTLTQKNPFTREKIERSVASLARDGLIRKKGTRWELA